MTGQARSAARRRFVPLLAHAGRRGSGAARRASNADGRSSRAVASPTPHVSFAPDQALRGSFGPIFAPALENPCAWSGQSESQPGRDRSDVALYVAQIEELRLQPCSHRARDIAKLVVDEEHVARL